MAQTGLAIVVCNVFSFQATASYSPNFIQVAQGRDMEQHGSRWIMTKHIAFCLESFTLRCCATIWPQRWYGEVVAGSYPARATSCYSITFVCRGSASDLPITLTSDDFDIFRMSMMSKLKKDNTSPTSPTSPVGSMRQRCVSVSSGVTFWSQVGGVSNADLADATEVAKALQPWEATDSIGLEVSIDQRPSMWPLKSLNWFETDGFLMAKDVQQLEFIWFYMVLLYFTDLMFIITLNTDDAT